MVNDFTTQLEKLPLYNAVALVTDTASYFEAIDNTLQYLLNHRKIGGIYVSSTRPANTLIKRLKDNNFNLDELYIVDCISYMVGGSGDAEHTTYLESPTMLENIMIKIDGLIRRIKSENKFVLIDSINTLAIYNDEKLLSEFLHILVNNLRVREIFTVIVSVEGQTPPLVENMLELVCDETIRVKR